MAFAFTRRLLVKVQRRKAGIGPIISDLFLPVQPPPKRGLNWWIYVTFLTMVPGFIWAGILYNTRSEIELVQEKAKALQHQEDWDKEVTKRVDRADVLANRKQRDLSSQSNAVPWR